MVRSYVVRADIVEVHHTMGVDVSFVPGSRSFIHYDVFILCVMLGE